MSIYRGAIHFANGHIIDQIWVNKDDALSYFQRCSNYDGCVRAELFELAPGNTLYETKSCLYEYDINGHYYYNAERIA